jgi:hypothetical protein
MPWRILAATSSVVVGFDAGEVDGADADVEAVLLGDLG